MVVFLGAGLLEVSGSSGEPPSGALRLLLQVRDVQREWRRLPAAGVAIEEQPTAKPWGLIEMVARDPDGLAIVPSRSRRSTHSVGRRDAFLNQVSSRTGRPMAEKFTQFWYWRREGRIAELERKGASNKTPSASAWEAQLQGVGVSERVCAGPSPASRPTRADGARARRMGRLHRVPHGMTLMPASGALAMTACAEVGSTLDVLNDVEIMERWLAIEQIRPPIVGGLCLRQLAAPVGLLL